jgi:hypothetical protein
MLYRLFLEHQLIGLYQTHLTLAATGSGAEVAEKKQDFHRFGQKPADG